MEPSDVSREWEDGFVVRRMTREEVRKVIVWYSAICPTSTDLEVAIDIRQYNADVDGFYVGELNGEMIASKIEIPVADGVSYGSMFYVDERYRKSGFGRRINDVARDITDSRSNNTVVIDSHTYLEAANHRRGYKTAYRLQTYSGKIQRNNSASSFKSGAPVLPVTESEFDGVMSFDDKCYVRPGCVWRRALMSRWIAIQGGRAVMAVSQHGDVIGYGCRRPAVAEAKHHLIGPLYADSYDIAWDLVQALTSDVAGHDISIFICELHDEAERLAREMNLEVDLPLIAMYRNGEPAPHNCRVFGVTSIDVCAF